MRWFLLISCLFMSGLFAQEEDAYDAKALLEEAKLRLEATPEDEKAETKSWRTAIHDRIALLNELITTQEDRSKLGDTNDVEARLAQVEAESGVERAKPAVESVQLASPDDLKTFETPFQEIEEEHTRKQAAYDALKAKIAQGNEESKNLPERAAQAKRKLEDIKVTSDLDRYRQENLQIESRVCLERQALLKKSGEVCNALRPLRQAERDLAKLKLDRAQAALTLAREQATSLREAEAQSIKEGADAEKAAAEMVDDPLEKFKRIVSAEKQRVLAEAKELENEVQRLEAEVVSRNEELDNIRDDRDQLEKRLKLREKGSDVFLDKVLKRTIRNRQLIKNVVLPELYEEADRSQQDLVKVMDLLWELQSPAQENVHWLKLSKELDEAEQEEGYRIFKEIVNNPDGALVVLKKKRTSLEKIEQYYGKLLTLTSTYSTALDRLYDFLITRLLWDRTTEPLGLGVLADAGRELLDFIALYTSKKMWAEVMESLEEDRSRIINLLVMGILLLTSLVLARWLRIRADEESAEVEEIHWHATVLQVVRTFIVSALPPIAIVLAANVLRRTELPTAVGSTLPSLMEEIAWFLLIRRFAWRLLRPNGIGERYLKFYPDVAAQSMKSLRLIAAFGMIFYAPHAMFAEEELGFEHLDHILYTGWLLGLVYAMILLIRKKGAIIRRWTKPDGFMRRLWVVLRPLFSLWLISIVIMDITGYRVASEFMLGRATRILIGLFVVGLLYNRLLRIMLALMKRIRSTMEQEQSAKEAHESSEQLASQLSRLLTVALVIFVFFTITDIMGSEAILVHHLEDVHIIDEVGRDDLNNKIPLTLQDVFVALLWIIGAHYVLQNLSALFEFIVFPLIGSTDRGGRFVWLALSRYAILLVSYCAALLSLHFSFSSLGWLVAACSVGLGFGLQEIVANFISGLILLVERPIRVGDIITVGTTGGTVEKIQIRATVVVNWERQTIVIPNKNFITQNLINWTRNDDIMRRTLPVRVAYGSDAGKVLFILNEVVGNHPNVLVEPPHRIIFDAFGSSSLDFVCWFFTPISVGINTRTELHKSVYERFREEGIEIPLPQQDLNVRERKKDSPWPPPPETEEDIDKGGGS